MLNKDTSRIASIITWIAQLLPALIMMQTLFFKFSEAEEPLYIFTMLGMEPAGRIAVGVLELIAAVLLLIPSFAWMGALLGTGLMLGALYFHITKLGFEVMNDGGYLVYLAIITLVSCLIVLFLKRKDLINFANATSGRENMDVHF